MKLYLLGIVLIVFIIGMAVLPTGSLSFLISSIGTVVTLLYVMVKDLTNVRMEDI